MNAAAVKRTKVVRQSAIERTIRAGLAMGLLGPCMLHYPDGRMMVRWGDNPDTDTQALPPVANDWD